MCLPVKARYGNSATKIAPQKAQKELSHKKAQKTQKENPREEADAPMVYSFVTFVPFCG